MKIAVETYIPVRELGVEAGLQAIAEAGFRYVDFTYYFELEALVASEDYLHIAKETRALMERLGLQCSQAHAPFNLQYNEPFQETSPNFQRIVRAMEAAALLGAPLIVVHALGVPDGAASAVSVNTNFRFYQALEPYCEKLGIRIGVENLGNALSTPTQLNTLLQQLNPSCFSACLDVGHANMLGIPPQDFIREILSGRLRSLHIHDNDGTDDQHQLPFLGKIDWGEVIRALKETGYHDDFTLESWRFLDCYPKELLVDALRLEKRTAEHLCCCFDALGKEKPEA